MEKQVCYASDLYEEDVSSPAEFELRSEEEEEEVLSDIGSEHPFGKTRRPSISKSRKSHREYPNYGTLKKNSISSADEPFDICLPGTLKEDFLEPCICDERNREKQIAMGQSIQEKGQVLGPGMILLKNYISLDEQVDIVRRCRKLGIGPGGFYVPKRKWNMKLHMMCLGLNWDAPSNTYGKRRQHDNAEPPSIPHEFSSLVRRAIDDSHKLIKSCSVNGENVLPHDILPPMSPNVCIVNFYTSDGRLGMHQDNAESHESLRRQLPVVSVSLGDSTDFFYGTERNVRKINQVLLESGDVLIFGGRSRDILHGVASIIPDTAPPLLVERAKLRAGRLNLTFREN